VTPAQLPLYPARDHVDGHPQCIECSLHARETVDRGTHRPQRIGWLTSVGRLATGAYVLRCLCGDYVVRSAQAIYNARSAGTRSKCRRCRLVVLRVQKRHMWEHSRRRSNSNLRSAFTRTVTVAGQIDEVAMAVDVRIAGEW